MAVGWDCSGLAAPHGVQMVWTPQMQPPGAPPSLSITKGGRKRIVRVLNGNVIVKLIAKCPSSARFGCTELLSAWWENSPTSFLFFQYYKIGCLWKMLPSHFAWGNVISLHWWLICEVNIEWQPIYHTPFSSQSILLPLPACCVVVGYS